jgi:hypothetical protein
MPRRTPIRTRNLGTPPPSPGQSGATRPLDDDPAEAIAGRLHRVAFGLFAALIVVRAFWPSEDAAEGSGLTWVLAILGVAGLAIISALISGTARFRFGWVDAAVLGLFALVGASAGHAADRRPALNLAWEWGGLAVAYMLARTLPRTRRETNALAAILVATATAIAAYGLYQIAVELPTARDRYRANPEQVLREIGVEPTGAGRRMYEDRLLGSNEPFATFGLANSLAGYLVGPTVLLAAACLDRFRKRQVIGVTPYVLAAVPGLVLLSCLLATKSRSAYLGLGMALALLAARSFGSISGRMLKWIAFSAFVLVAAMVAVGLASGQLDLLVMTQSSKSLRYRFEYWQGAWRILRFVPGAFWQGLGPGNFAGPYLVYKLPQASEEISDPHNLFLEVWTTAGVFAAVLLASTLLLTMRSALGRATVPVDAELGSSARVKVDTSKVGWLLAWAASGWFIATTLNLINPFNPVLGPLNPFQGDLFFRWIILGVAWVSALAMIWPLWNSGTLPAEGAGAAVVAIVVNLLAAGGIGMPAVALGLWLSIALALNLRDDRAEGVERRVGRTPTFLVAAAWAALIGSFFGSIAPYWKSEAAIVEADRQMIPGRLNFERARAAYSRAIKADRFNVHPWIGLADLEYRFWLSPESKRDPRVWPRVLMAMDNAVGPPRNAANYGLQRRRALIARAIEASLGDAARPGDLILLRTHAERALRFASKLNPTLPLIHAELAESSAGMNFLSVAQAEAKEALRLDAHTPHPDKKLPDDMRKRLLDEIPEWAEKAKQGESFKPSS